MAELSLEKNLSAAYLLSAVLGMITLACTTIPWQHWSEILENCEESNVYCGCILYGTEQFNYFTGGSNRLCHFVVYASVPVVLISLVLTGYHGYRSIIVPKKMNERRRQSEQKIVRVNRRTGEVVPLSPPSRPSGHAWSGADPSCVCWGPLAILAALIAALLFAQAVVLSDGYRRTCHEYRKHVVKATMATGMTADVIYDRMGCESVFDFMDYLEPFTRPYRPFKDRDWRYPYMEERDRSRGGKINTAVALRFAMATCWINCIVFVAIIVHNSILARSTPGFIKCCCC